MPEHGQSLRGEGHSLLLSPETHSLYIETKGTKGDRLAKIHSLSFPAIFDCRIFTRILPNLYSFMTFSLSSLVTMEQVRRQYNRRHRGQYNEDAGLYPLGPK